MRKFDTEIWTDGNEDAAITVQGGVTAPSDSFDSFMNAFISYLSAASSMPVEVLLLKFNSNYSASRAAMVMFWRVWEAAKYLSVDDDRAHQINFRHTDHE